MTSSDTRVAAAHTLTSDSPFLLIYRTSTFIPRSIVEQAFEYSSKDASVTFADFKRTLVQFLVNGTDFVSRFCDLSSPTPSPAPEAATEPAAETADANSSSSSSENER